MAKRKKKLPVCYKCNQAIRDSCYSKDKSGTSHLNACPMPRKLRKPDPDGQNKDRAEWAGAAVAAFQSLTGTDDCDAVKDLLCDLMHYCDENPDNDFATALDSAREHYKAETSKEG